MPSLRRRRLHQPRHQRLRLPSRSRSSPAVPAPVAAAPPPVLHRRGTASGTPACSPGASASPGAFAPDRGRPAVCASGRTDPGASSAAAGSSARRGATGSRAGTATDGSSRREAYGRSSGRSAGAPSNGAAAISAGRSRAARRAAHAAAGDAPLGYPRGASEATDGAASCSGSGSTAHGAASCRARGTGCSSRSRSSTSCCRTGPGGFASGAARPVNPFLTQDPGQKARRLARALISDLAVYYPDRRKEGLASGNLKELFEEEIKKSWEEYTEQVGKEMADTTTYFTDALNEILAGGRKMF